jgi:8-oxo-dGTP pyrophosphatase MutT (NUDIX family)
MSDRDFTITGGRTVFEGAIFDVRVEDVEFADGTRVTRDVVRHPGAAAAVAYDDEAVYLVRQPRPAQNDPDSLELPAGLLDVEGEPPLATAKRELAEEIHRAASQWEFITRFRPSVGVSDEETHIFAATGLREAIADSGEDERIEIVAWPLTDLDGALEASRDAKTIIGLMWLRERLRSD